MKGITKVPTLTARLLRLQSSLGRHTDRQRSLAATSAMSTSYVFTYGTLKRGEPNHSWMTSAKPENGRAELVGAARTVRAFPLLVAGPYNIPYCLDRPGHGHNIRGEVYKIDAEKLGQLDILEAYPAHYNRRLEDIHLLDDPDATPLKAWIYLWEKYTDEHLKLPFIDNYTNNESSESGRYVPRDQRTKLPY